MSFFINIVTSTTISTIYQQVPSNKLRYVVGSILSEGSSEINDKEVKEFTKEGFKILHLPEVNHLLHSNKIWRSYFIQKQELNILPDQG